MLLQFLWWNKDFQQISRTANYQIRSTFRSENAGDNPLDYLLGRDMAPSEKTPQTVTPGDEPSGWCAYPEKPPPSVLAKWLARKTLKNLSVYNIVSFFWCEKLCVADTKACSLITRSQLANYCVIPTLVSDQCGMSDLLNKKLSWCWQQAGRV